MPMQISPAGIDLIKRFEGCRLSAYLDAIDVPTIGYGHTGGVKMGDVITQDQADAMLANDVQVRVNAVNAIVTKPVTQGQFDALVSFAYNCGVANLLHSTLMKMINRGEADSAGPQFLLWSRAGGKVLPGLVRRRQSEKDMYEGDV